MTKSRPNNKPSEGKTPREERLRAALRANLARRKAQSRARKSQGDSTPEQD